MTLNKEDFAILQGNVRQIENYLRSLMPEIVKSFSVGFGPDVYHMSESQYRLFVEKDTLSGAEGSLSYEFIPDEVKVTGCENVYSRGHGEEFMQKLVLNWPKIKEKIQVIIGAQQNKLDKIRNFTL